MNLKKFLNQTAVYWGSPTSDGFGGTIYSDPVEVKVRWTDKQDRYLSGQSYRVGNVIIENLSKAVILSDTEFEIGGRLLLGSLANLSSDELPDSNGALLIDQVSKIPDKLAKSFLIKSWLL